MQHGRGAAGTVAQRDALAPSFSRAQAALVGTGRAATVTRREMQVHDLEHEGKWPEDFAAVANAHIRARRAAGFGLTRPAASAFLSLDETLAVRLYSGPSFGPINDFLRQIAHLRGVWRHALLTYLLTYVLTY